MKPRLLFFRPIRTDLPGYIQEQLAQQARCLALFFDVSVVGGSCDFDEQCARYQPDLVIFESGAYARGHEIANTARHPHLPRLGFLNADAYCPSRSVFAGDMERWRVDGVFTLSVAMGEYFPALADRLFVWPNCIDPAQYGEASCPKTIPLLFTGNHASHYPWRIRVHDLLARLYPTFTVPRQSWTAEGRQMPQGETYRRLLNASWFVPACGTIAKDLVRKHFEIPAAGACLVAEDTASLRAAGFRDMENCVLADTHDIADKLDFLFERPDDYARIVKAGRDLVLARHTQANRSQILQWFDLRRQGGASASIVQDNPFGDLRLASRADLGKSRHVVSGGVDRVLLVQAAEAMAKSRFADAGNLFRRCLNYHPIPEAMMGLAQVAIRTGSPDEAEHWLHRSMRFALEDLRAPEPDPVEWAWLLRAVLCGGDAGQARELAARHPAMRHPELDRMRQVLGLRAGESGVVQRTSVHTVPESSAGDWQRDLVQDLRACGQSPDLAAPLGEASNVARAAVPGARNPVPSAIAGGRAPSSRSRVSRAGERRLRLWAWRLPRRLKRVLRPFVRGPLPDPFHQELTGLAARADIRSVAVFGSGMDAGIAAALLAGAQRNPGGKPRLVFHGDGGATALGAHEKRPLRLVEAAVFDEQPLAADLAVFLGSAEATPERISAGRPRFVLIEEHKRDALSGGLRDSSGMDGYDLETMVEQARRYTLFRRRDGAAFQGNSAPEKTGLRLVQHGKAACEATPL
ncbi:MAG: glycosyltransferase family 1 protein [Methylobacterium mesophilicum]|nr:glycosyltransferase family 1 protein [Methylobacterium mesophilicum]